MLWGIISCSIPSQEGVYVFFYSVFLCTYFLPGYLLFPPSFCLSVCVGGFLSGILSVEF